jgi:glycosyltransferase involved in cell wall biosynthesis
MTVGSAPKVSVLLPSLNAREFLEPRIVSLLNQTFTDWESIVLDSHSTDGTWEFFESIASSDSRFRLYQIPREGLYAALNRGLDLATGEFLHVATCDDTMAPEFLTETLQAFSRCPEAGIVACDALLINRDGNELSAQDLVGRLTKRATKNLLSLDTVRTAFPGGAKRKINYRPVPHDCLLHFDGRSVYLSLNQLLVRTALAKAAGPFETTIGSVADFDWLLRLTSSTGSVHVPKKLAMWRYHGNQLSLCPDLSRPGSRRAAAERALKTICDNNPILLSRNDRAALFLPFKIFECRSPIGRVFRWFESAGRLARMFFERPIPTLRALLRVKFRFGTRRHSLLPIIFQNTGLAPKQLSQNR